MIRINYTVGAGNVITSWTEIPFNENLPTLEVDDPSSIHIGFDKISGGKLERHAQEYLDWREAQIARNSKLSRIQELKDLLAATDYQAIKHSEGLIPEEEYASIKAQREGWRAEINQLEEELAA